MLETIARAEDNTKKLEYIKREEQLIREEAKASEELATEIVPEVSEVAAVTDANQEMGGQKFDNHWPETHICVNRFYLCSFCS